MESVAFKSEISPIEELKDTTNYTLYRYDNTCFAQGQAASGKQAYKLAPRLAGYTDYDLLLHHRYLNSNLSGAGKQLLIIGTLGRKEATTIAGSYTTEGAYVGHKITVDVPIRESELGTLLYFIWTTQAGYSFCFASGKDAYAYQRAAIAIGENVIASGNLAKAIGLDVFSTASQSTGIGDLITCSGFAAVGIGSTITVNGDYSLGIGSTNTISGLQSLSIGHNNSVLTNARNSVALGSTLYTDKARSIVIGNNARAETPGDTVFANGRFLVMGDLSSVISRLAYSGDITTSGVNLRGANESTDTYVNYINISGTHEMHVGEVLLACGNTTGRVLKRFSFYAVRKVNGTVEVGLGTIENVYQEGWDISIQVVLDQTNKKYTLKLLSTSGTISSAKVHVTLTYTKLIA